MAKKIIYAEDNEDIREIFALKVQLLSNIEVTKVDSGNAAIEILKEKGSEYCLVLSDYNMDDGNGLDLYNFILSENLQIPFVLMTGENPDVLKKFESFKESNPYNRLLDKPPAGGTLEESLAFLKDCEKGQSSLLDNEFIPVCIRLLYRGRYSPTDIYLKLSENKHVHLYHEGDPLTVEDILKYEKKKVDKVYIKNDRFKYFVDEYIEIISHSIREAKDGITPKSVEITYDVHELVHKQLISIGLSKESIALTKKSIESTIDSIKSEPKLLQAFTRMANKADFLYEHSLFLSFLSVEILNILEWSSQDTLYKISIASFFHDITLPDGKLAKEWELEYEFADVDEIRKKNFTYLDHSSDSAQYVHDFREIPPDANAIIVQSHERPDGLGFPKGLTAHKTFPLACVVNIAHSILNAMYRDGFEKIVVEKRIRQMEKTYLRGQYEQPFLAAKKLFKII